MAGMRLVRAIPQLVLASAIAMAGCASPEPADPARAKATDRLRQDAQLTIEELDHLRAEILRAIGDRAFAIEGDVAKANPALAEERRKAVFSMLTEPAGLFDEGLRDENGTRLRILNAPGWAPTSEIDAARRLWIDVDTLIPVRFAYAYNFPSAENYSYEITIDD